MKKSLLLFLGVLIPMLARAYVVPINGIYYELDENNKVAKLTYKDTEYNSYSGTVVIPETVKYNGTEYSVTEISDYAFLKCNSLTSVTISNSVTAIGKFAFSDCSQLSSITFGTKVASVDINAFRNCTSLKYVNIFDLAAWCNISFKWVYLTERIDNSNPLIFAHHLYLNGKEIKNLTIPNSVTTVKQATFQGCSGLTSVTIHNGVTSIERGAFQGCSGLVFVSIPNNVTTINDGAFQGCSSLSTVTIPNSVTSIGDGAFHSCSSLTTLTIGNSLTNIGSLAFKGCSSLKNVYCHANAVPTTLSSFSEVDVKNAVLHVPTGTVEAYNNSNQWKLFKAIVEIDAPTYTLTYKVDGENYKSYSLREGVTIDPEPAPTKDGYKFTGWSYIPKTMPAENVTVIGIFEKLPEEDVITLSKTGKAWYCSKHDLNFTNVEDLKAYTATGFDPETNRLWLTRVNEVPAGTGIMLKGNAGVEYHVPYTVTRSFFLNMFKGDAYNDMKISKIMDEYTNFYLNKSGLIVPFGSDVVTYPAGMCYLQIPTSLLANPNTRSIEYVFEDENNTTDIYSSTTEQQSDVYYNLQGQQVDNPQKGLYIKNGYKVVIR